MSDVNYPVYKACNFLAVNYFEDISSTFEEYLCDTLIEENSFLLKQKDNIVPNVDRSYRRPWEELLCDKDFVSVEANNIKDSISVLCQGSEPVANSPKWFLTEDILCESKSSVLEENVNGSNEKDLDHLREKAFCGEDLLIDEPPIPFDLQQCIKNISLSPLFKKLPMMEVDGMFDSDQNFLFEEEQLFFEETKKEVIKKLPSFELEIPLEEIKLSEISPEEVMFLEDRELEDNYLKDSSYCIQKEKLINSSLTDSVKTDIIETASNLKNSFYQKSIFSEPNPISNENSFLHMRSLPTPVPVLSSSKDENSTLPKCDDVIPSLENYFENNELDCFECDTNEEPRETSINCANGTFWPNSSNTSSVVKKDDDLQKSSSITFELDKEEELGYSFTNEITDPNKPEEIENIPDHLGYDDCPDVSIMNDSLIENNYSQGNELHPLVRKVSNLQLKNNFPTEHRIQNLPFLPKADGSQNIQSFTAVCKGHKPNNKVLCANKNISVRKEIEPSPKVSELFKFMNIRKLPPKHLDYPSSQSLSIDPRTYDQIQDVGKSNTSFKKEDSLHFVKPLILNEVLQHTFLPDVKDIFVQLPDAFVDVVLMYETAALPFLQSLIACEKFNFPSNLTLANIPSYKSCFLLNQEAKQCQDSILKKDERNYYRNLLCLHGIIKSLEIFLGFDSQLSISALQDFQNSHESLIKGEYRNLIRKLTSVINNMCETYSIHPKVKELCNFIKEKSKYYKENDLEFKVLLILRKHMDLFCDSFEAELTNGSIEMKLILIPESVVLNSSTLLFKSSENTVYVVNSSSLSKHIPWKSLKLVIEYEYEYDRSHWEEICTRQNIPHVFVKVSDLPLKTLEEIRKLPFKETNKRQKKYLILSSHVASQYQLLYILETKLNATICIRQYKELLPHMHFADIVVDENSAVILVSEVSFHSEDFSSILCDRISFLYLKYEACWIIIQGKDKNVKMKDTELLSTKNTFWNFFLNCKDFSEVSKNFKIKILHAHNIEETVDLIKCISAFGSRLKANVIEEPKISLSKQVSQDELFLLSFPCLNPYVVHIILSEYSLGTFINLDLDECCKTLHTVPCRFLKCFYSTLNKPVASNHRETLLSQFQNPSLESQRFSKRLDIFELVPSLVENTEDFHLPSVFPKQCNFTSSVDKSIEEILKTGSQNSWQSSPSTKTIRKPDLTLEEIDLDYMALKLGDKYEGYSPSENGCVSSRSSSRSLSSNSFTLSPKEDIGGRELQVIPNPIDDVRPNVHSLFNPEEPRIHSVNSPLSELPEMGLSLDIFQMNNELDSEISSSGRKKLYFDPMPYFFTPKKRKYSSDSTESSSGSPSCHSKRSCRIQKGVSSKRVTKQDFMYSAPSLNHGEITTSLSSEVRKDLPSWPAVKRSNSNVKNYFHRKTEKLRRESEFFNKSPISSQNYISSPSMSQSSMLGLVKVPGNGGQTKLRFM